MVAPTNKTTPEVMRPDLESPSNVVYQRTHKGQVVCASRASVIDPHILKLLRLFNGFTPVDVIEGLVAAHVPQARDIIAQLVARGLIEESDPSRLIEVMRERRAAFDQRPAALD